VVDPEQVEQILRRHDGSLQEICRGLIEAARQAGAPDNVTVVLLRKAA
jgi:serine/threonine protein phosphatase PrpC